MPQYLISPEDITEKKFVIRNSSEIWHLTKVLRVKPGETINIFDGNLRHYQAVIKEIDSFSITGDILKEIIYKEKKYSVHIYPSLINADRFEFMLEKATEVGVDIISPVITERTMARIPEPKIKSKLERWNKIILAAVKQCDCQKIPKLTEAIVDFSAAIKAVEKTSLNLIAYEAEPNENSLKSILSQNQKDSINLFLGPEGGFTEKEITLAKENGFKTFSLGQNILRAETAAISCLSIIHSELG
ncbi:MAG: hypothetical protein A3J83_08890 [Elusimicrobia bacterium RIFOXYA2_FULL_40_6]|nr:MAG: hypothetical protein A3J83_08890 [Elusimicrobia bacterium RIFOXYA2_FULL_40_6]